ncbi:type II toxin-antitoxin system VapC family toxin [Notoacmeibacter sp. MSK16QG-6]|uniref:type II toxin-antitoxin system VapC family toxin n=1 Tax=Notoacmeibacter sp. MSK16QG-6 TaxID=2957982 RepID=UPI00209FAA2D|nr:type II toxin-antitoxin system VapC family toxin [Notoacmeibacter sp. MSK16QG-6]MCP1198753.1 type II toxin-antitoxin system VapC family toxin [Notoacmeibacter sp. MSK16QG-6]
MIVDASAILAILLHEEERQVFRRLIASESCRLSPVNLWEVAAKLEREAGQSIDLSVWLDASQIAIEPITAQHAETAIEARRRYGKGEHPARLNLGDCFAYALAKTTGEPLLFKGDDFRQTDIEAAA